MGTELKERVFKVYTVSGQLESARCREDSGWGRYFPSDICHILGFLSGLSGRTDCPGSGRLEPIVPCVNLTHLGHGSWGKSTPAGREH